MKQFIIIFFLVLFIANAYSQQIKDKNGKTIATIRPTKTTTQMCKGTHNSKVLYTIRGNKVCKGTSYHSLYEIKGINNKLIIIPK